MALIVPAVAVVVLRLFFAARMAWWEYLLPFGVSILTIFLGKLCADKVAVYDTEYWGGWVVRATYYEPWDEEVPCSHMKWRTVTHTDSKGNSYRWALAILPDGA